MWNCVCCCFFIQLLVDNQVHNSKMFIFVLLKIHFSAPLKLLPLLLFFCFSKIGLPSLWLSGFGLVLIEKRFRSKWVELDLLLVLIYIHRLLLLLVELVYQVDRRNIGLLYLLFGIHLKLEEFINQWRLWDVPIQQAIVKVIEEWLNTLPDHGLFS